MKLYELAYIANPNLSSEEINSLQEELINIISKIEGVLGKSSSPQKRALAYPVKDQTEAYLSCVEFSIPENVLKSIEDEVKKNKNILRYLIIKKPVVKKVEVEARPEKKKSLKPEKTKLKEIDKEIDEII